MTREGRRRRRRHRRRHRLFVSVRLENTKTEVPCIERRRMSGRVGCGSSLRRLVARQTVNGGQPS